MKKRFYSKALQYLFLESDVISNERAVMKNRSSMHNICSTFCAYGAILFFISLIFIPEWSTAWIMQADGAVTEEGTSAKEDSSFTANLFYKVDVETPISLHLEDKSVKYALKEIARETGLRLTYVGRIETDKQVTLVNSSIGLSEALAHVLEGTQLEPRFSSNGYLLITTKVPDIKSSSESARTDNQQQYGAIIGVVTDASTGETLPGANVVIKNTTHGVSTDIDGRYSLRRVPAGQHVLEISFLGFHSHEVPVTVEVDGRLEVRVELAPDLIEGDEIFVVARQRGQARSLTRQRQSVNIRSVVSAEQIDRFADQTVEGALQRVAGMGHGGTNIRGVGPAASNITMDGQRMGSTGGGDRSVDLGTISADMIQELDVIKVITPDMDADALSGAINISTRRPVGGARTLNARIGGGYNTRFAGTMGPSSRASISYGDSPREDFSFAFNMSYQRGNDAQEAVRTEYGTRNFGEGPVDVLNAFRHSMTMDPRDRYAAGLQFTFQPTDRATYHVQGMFNLQQRNQQFHEYRYGIRNERYTSPFQTGPWDQGPQSTIRYDPELTTQQIHQYTFRTGARILFDKFDLDYSLGWGHGRFVGDKYHYLFETDHRFDFIIDYPDRWHPNVSIAPWGLWSEFPTLNQFQMSSGFDAGPAVNHFWDRHINNEFKTSVDVEVPFSRGTFKFGTSGLMTFKDGTAERYDQTFQSRIDLVNFKRHIKTDWRTFGRQHESYHMPYLLDLNAARQWYESLIPDFNMNINTWAEAAEGNSYTANEFTFGGYGMSTIELSRFKFMGGIRLEYAGNNYKGRDGTIDQDGRWLGAVDISARNTYFNLFPNAQIVYAVMPRSNVRLAYSRSIGRPSFTELSPSTIRNFSAETIRRGNPDLKPMLSNNLDLLFDHYFMNVGQFAIGIYYKELSDFVFRIRERVGEDGIDGEGRHAGWWATEYRNGKQAKVYGLEVSWQQHLDFLPGFLGNFATYTNYSYAYSEADLERDEPARLVGQRPHVVNAGLDYSHGAFSAQLSYQWGAPSISSYGERRWVPEIQLQERVWFDEYRAAANDVSMTIRYRLTDEFRIWADGSNLLNNRSVNYQYDPDFYPLNSTLIGRSISLGLHYSL